MATTGIVQGDVMGVYIGGTLIAATLVNNFDLGLDLRDANNADTGDSKSKLPGRYGGSVSGRSHFEFDAAYGYSDLFAVLIGRSQVAVVFSSEVIGDKEYSFNGYITQLKATFPDHENSEYDWAVEIDGDVSEDEIVA